ncbi:hypothetical protein CY34DRAFT_610321 [Suillus luteus UH-Slu-Lm8-n1]|uniref:Uncharacterized protein n=1 Tax=Suillus luteus UH-Slu-Lm8-n1 TaxID=930992 RepID=A0A0D0B3U3_9AGAM|nr:hypothetical protein CY34DRAFT_610321 [Suillus luteus UH-Slu-Lm8-n1]
MNVAHPPALIPVFSLAMTVVSNIVTVQGMNIPPYATSNDTQILDEAREDDISLDVTT